MQNNNKTIPVFPQIYFISFSNNFRMCKVYGIFLFIFILAIYLKNQNQSCFIDQRRIFTENASSNSPLNGFTNFLWSQAGVLSCETPVLNSITNYVRFLLFEDFYRENSQFWKFERLSFGSHRIYLNQNCRSLFLIVTIIFSKMCQNRLMIFKFRSALSQKWCVNLNT